MPTIVCITSQKPSVTWKTSPRQALSLTVTERRGHRTPRETAGRGSTGRRCITSRPLLHAGSRLALAEAASPHGPHRPCARHPRETEAGLVLPLPTPVSPQRASSRLPVDSGWLRQALPVAGNLLGKRDGSQVGGPSLSPLRGAVEQPPQQPRPSWPWLPVSRRLAAVDARRGSKLELRMYP